MNIMRISGEAESRYPQLAGKSLRIMALDVAFPATGIKVRLKDEESGRLFWILLKHLETVE